IAQNIRYFARILGAPTSDEERVIEQVGLSEFASQQVGHLSGVHLSGVSRAVALLDQPELLVLDEPTVGLDPVLRRDLWELFAGLAASGLSLLISSHVMDEASRCDDLILMRDGVVLAHDTVQQILADTGSTDVEAAFLTLVEGK